MKKLGSILLIVLPIVAMILLAGISTVQAKEEYDSDLYEARKPFSDGIVLQCAGRKLEIDCNWDRYNAELQKKQADQAAANAEAERLLLDGK